MPEWNQDGARSWLLWEVRVRRGPLQGLGKGTESQIGKLLAIIGRATEAMVGRKFILGK